MRILFATHTAAWSGAETILGGLIEGLSSDHELAVACPPTGRFADEIDRLGIRRFAIPAVEASFRLHPLQTPAGLASLASAGAALAYAVHRFEPDIVHANTVRAGLVAALATSFRGPPVVVSVHDNLPATRLGHAVRLVIAGGADRVVAVSGFTAARFNQGLECPVAFPVYNGIDHERFDPARADPAPLRSELGLPADAPLLGIVAQITPWKGQDTAIGALAQLRRDGIAAHLLVVGEVVFSGRQVRYDNHAFLRELHRLTIDLEVADAVHFLGQRSDVPAILRALDLLLLPSREEPFALAAMESMAMGTPALVSSEGGVSEVIEDGLSGRLIPSGRPGAWAAAARELLQDPDQLRRMGERARQIAAGFSRQRHRQEMLKVYAELLDRPSGARQGAAARSRRASRDAAPALPRTTGSSRPGHRTRRRNRGPRP